MKYTLTVTSDNPQELVDFLGGGDKPIVLGSDVQMTEYTPDTVETEITIFPAPTLEPEPAGAGVTDADGVHWDAELHASPPSQTSTGKWRKRRGAAKAAEPQTPPSVLPEIIDTTVTYSALVNLMNTVMEQGLLGNDDLAAFYTKCNVTNLAELPHDQEAINRVHVELMALGQA